MFQSGIPSLHLLRRYPILVPFVLLCIFLFPYAPVHIPPASERVLSIFICLHHPPVLLTFPASTCPFYVCFCATKSTSFIYNKITIPTSNSGTRVRLTSAKMAIAVTSHISRWLAEPPLDVTRLIICMLVDACCDHPCPLTHGTIGKLCKRSLSSSSHINSTAPKPHARSRVSRTLGSEIDLHPGPRPHTSSVNFKPIRTTIS